MEIVYDASELENYMTHAVIDSPDHPILVDHFLEGAIEVDVDAIAEDVEFGVGHQDRDFDQQVGLEVQPGHLAVDPHQFVAHSVSQ